MDTLNRKHLIILATLALVIISVAFSTQRSTVGLGDFVVLTREDPLFYSPFFDGEAFDDAVEELKQSEERLKKTALYNISLSKENYVDSYTTLIRDTPLFPTDFLALLPDISKKTEAFTANPTAQKARELLSLYEQAQKAYEKDALSMAEAYKVIASHIPADRPVYYFFINSATSVRLAQDNFNLIYQNSLALKEEIERRQECLSGKGGCERNQQNEKSLSGDDLGALVTQATLAGNNSSFVRDTLPFASTTRDVRGPFAVSSPCWGDTSAQPMYAVYATNEKGNKTILPKLAQENYYTLVSPQATDIISTKIRDMGLTFYSQAEGTTYECSDLNFYPDILTLDFIHQNEIATSSLSQLWNNKFGLLSPALYSLADFTNLLETSQRISTDFVLSPQFLFTTRSAYSLTYLPFAQSVWRIEDKPQFLLSQDAFEKLNAPKQFKTLTELKRQGFTEPKIKKSHINQKQFIESLVPPSSARE